MARIDDYINARKLAIEQLAGDALEEISRRSGFEIESGNRLRVPFLNRQYHILYPEMSFAGASETDAAEIPVQEQVLILHYILGSKNAVPPSRWVAYREIPGASFYHGAFLKRAVNPLKSMFGQDTAAFKKTAAVLNGKPVEPGDSAFEFRVFPHISIQLIIWEGDEEFPAEANILLEDGIGNILSPEDVAWMAGMVVYRLMALSRSV